MMMVQHIIKLAMGLVDCVAVMMQFYYYNYNYRCYCICYRFASSRAACCDIMAIEMGEERGGGAMMWIVDDGLGRRWSFRQHTTAPAARRPAE